MDCYNVGDLVEGCVVNVIDFGFFIDIYDGLEGLVYVSEIDILVGKLEDYYLVGEFVCVCILCIEDDEKKVGFIMCGVDLLMVDEIVELEVVVVSVVVEVVVVVVELEEFEDVEEEVFGEEVFVEVDFEEVVEGDFEDVVSEEE